MLHSKLEGRKEKLIYTSKIKKVQERQIDGRTEKKKKEREKERKKKND